MSKQSEALQLADCLDGDAKTPWPREEAAAELRRLHAQRAELLEALKEALNLIETISPFEGETVRKACAAIAKAEGQ